LVEKEGMSMAYYNNNRQENNENFGWGCLVYIFLGIFVLPLVGLYFLLSGKSTEQRIIGLALFVVGILIWAAIGK